jgi:signal transduction histidine kinase/ActR/RegA family two-component response regulator
MIGSLHDVFTDPRYPDNDLASLAAAVSAREPYANKRLVLSLPDGRVVWFRVGGRPRVAADGTFLGYRGAATDITTEMLTEERRQQAQKLTALGRLAGGIAHDFNNVLGAIIGFAQFLREDLAPDGEPHDFAERILHAADRARGLTRQILSFARSGTEARKPLPFGRVVGDMLPLLRAALSSTTTIELAIRAEDAWVLGNETELSQLVLNLCVNASDAFEGRYGTVRVRVEDPDADTLAPDERGPATATADPAGIPNAVCLIVDDDGIGMSDGVLRQVFEPFFTTKPSGRGTGLGLSVVHGIVTTMGGAITIASRPDRGTRVQVFLPRTAATAALETGVEPAAVHGSGRVLVAEDDGDVAAMTVALLTRLGYRVERRADAAETLAAIEAAPARWDLVLSDFAMPNTTGLDLIRAIKRLRPDLPCILITGFMEGVTEDAVLAAGADALLHKPLDQRAFSETVQRFIRRPEPASADPAL